MPVPKGTRVGGRKKGTPNKVTADVKVAAQHYTTQALRVLSEIMNGSKHPAAARVSAANVLLDRGHGKPSQAVELDANMNVAVRRIEREIIDPAAHPDS